LGVRMTRHPITPNAMGFVSKKNKTCIAQNPPSRARSHRHG
jgi:hypothetical protein